MTQRELAERVGVNVTYISKIENGEFPSPSEKVIKKIAQALEYDYQKLMLLADKLPSDYASMIRKNPRIADFMRVANSLTESQWNEIQKIISKGEG